MKVTAVTISFYAFVANAVAGSVPSGFKAEVRATTATTCDGSIGCIAGTQYCASNDGTLTNLHVPCTVDWEEKRDLTLEDLLEARAACPYTPTCINFDEYCVGNSHFSNLHIPCIPKREAAVKARTDCAGSIGCIAGTEYCSYEGQLTNLHTTCGDDWEWKN